MKFNFDFTMVALDGTSLTDETGTELHAGRALAGMIMRTSEGGPDTMIKFDWATQLYKTGWVDLDKAGQIQFKKMIEGIPNLWLIVRGTILEVLENRKAEFSENKN
jgi:hypothetical protein